MRSKLFVFVGLLVVASMILAACQPKTIIQTVIVAGTPQVVVVTPSQKWVLRFCA